ncbi:MAG: hypothetical protein CME70_02195 [Halobacteriovorax sp.]|nr:hypothetical protein [Halobacteriovorax sp.]|tara:strand:+ start:53006 stop:53419 length:414 start_codon:yes stop_codon:yes gene_type:complete
MKNLVVVAFLALISGAVQAEVLNCGGTEPFWSLTINEEDKTVVYNDFNGEENLKTFKNLKVAKPINDTSVRSITAERGFRGRKKLSAVVLLTDGDYRTYCSDGMSDFQYQYEIILNLDGQPLQGCCESSQRPRRGDE